ncbi:MAG TPA: nuclear transport factor 2 family protein [Longimicrobiales bacterium]
MNTRITTLLLAGLIASACADADQTAQTAETDAPPATAASADEAAIEQLRADYVSHYNQHHPDVVAGMFTDSVYALWADGTVNMTRSEVQASLTQDMEATPTLTLETGDVMVFGDNAVARGSYTVNLTPPGAAPVALSGSYITHFTRVDGAWKINGLASNYDTIPPAAAVPEPAVDEPPPPPEEGTMDDVVAAYTTLLAAGDWAGLANLYTDDAVVAFSNAPPLQGRSAVQARFAEQFTGPASIEVHDVGTLDLGGGFALDGGWYTLNATTSDGAISQSGAYLNLMRQQADGSWKIHWSVSNGQPTPAT